MLHRIRPILLNHYKAKECFYFLKKLLLTYRFVCFKDLKNYLDNSKHGVIYISFGTNVDTNTIPQEKVVTLIKAFSELPYDVLWKWNSNEMHGKTENIKISKWFPQSDLLSK